MDILRSTASLLGSIYPEKNIYNKEETYEIGDRLLAVFPSALGYHYRYHYFNHQKINTKGLKSETISEHLLRLIHNKKCTDAKMIKCINVSLICYAEHGFAASTFAARVTTSTLSDTYSAIVSAIGTLRGNLHGGANEAAMELLNQFKTPEEALIGIKQMITKKINHGFWSSYL